MKIDKIRKMANGKYKIEFDNHENIITYDDVILKNNLLFHQKLAQQELLQLENETAEYDLYYKCVKWISRRIRSEKEIRNYIFKLTSENREDIIQKLKQHGFINDKIFASSFIYDKMNLSNEGPDKIRKELLEHQIPEEVIEEELSKYREEEIDLKLEKLIQKKIKAGLKYSKYFLKQKLLYYFTDLGYAKEKIDFFFEKNYVSDNQKMKKEYEKVKTAIEKKYPNEDNRYRICQKLYQKGYAKEEIDEILKSED